MKNRLDTWLALGALLSAIACIPAWLVEIRLLLVLPGICLFCLELLICRRTSALSSRLLPLGVDAAAAVVGWSTMTTARGWDGLFGAILLLASISPAVGILLAWGGHALYVRMSKNKEAADEG